MASSSSILINSLDLIPCKYVKIGLFCVRAKYYCPTESEKLERQMLGNFSLVRDESCYCLKTLVGIYDLRNLNLSHFLCILWYLPSINSMTVKRNLQYAFSCLFSKSHACFSKMIANFFASAWKLV
jgi:hypothetical protein